MTHGAGGQLDRRPGDCRFTEVERSAATADPALDHHQPGFRPTYGFRFGVLTLAVPGRFKFLNRGAGKERCRSFLPACMSAVSFVIA